MFQGILKKEEILKKIKILIAFFSLILCLKVGFATEKIKNFNNETILNNSLIENEISEIDKKKLKIF